MKSIYKAGWLLSSTQAIGLLATFLRNLLIARFVTPDEYGIAVTFALAISALEMASDFAWDKLIIQSDDGDGARLVNSAHTMMVIRGFLIAIGIFFFADSIAEIFGVPEVASSYELLALAPLLRGFAHLDVKRFQRKMRFHAEAYVLLFSQLASLVSVFTLIPFIEDHTLMLYAVITQASVQLISSHYFAERQYGVCFDREMFVRMIVFGWPLILNSFLMIASNEGDKLLVGNAFGVAELALYSIVVMLIYAPGVIIRKTTSSIALPVLSKAKDDVDAFYKTNRIYAGAVMFATVALVVPVSLFGSSFIEDVFGDGYSGPVILVTWLCVGLGAQIIRSWPVTVSLAMGDTKNVLYGNIYRLIGFGLAVVCAYSGLGYIHVAASMALGEVIAVIASLIRVNRLRGDSAFSNFSYLIFSFVVMGCLLLTTVTLGDIGYIYGVGASIIVGLGTVLAWISYCPFVRDVVKERLSKQPSTCE